MSLSQNSRLQAAVQRNCHVSDARHAGDYTLCIYLLKMREYFRWENSRGFDDTLPHDEVGVWLKQREEFWNQLEEESFTKIPVNGDLFDPFDTEHINQQLVPQGIVYSGGIGRKAEPHFFLAKLQQQHRRNNFSILVCAEEYARDLTSPPAMTLGSSIFIRRESVRRMVWERIEEWKWNKPDNASGRAIACYDFDSDLHTALEEMTDNEVELVLAHEIGEVLAGEQLGTAWEDLLFSLPRSRAEIVARAIRDHLADALSTLPEILNKKTNAGAIHQYISNLNGMRKDLCPSLTEAYRTWHETGDQRLLQSYTDKGPDHWLGAARSMLELFQQYTQVSAQQLDDLIQNNRL